MIDFIRIPEMRRFFFAVGIALGPLVFSMRVSGEELALIPSDRILILAPHPDDEVLCCGGMIQQAAEAHIPVLVVFLTNGDYNRWSMTVYRHHPVFRPSAMLELGEIRRQESLSAAKVLGLDPKALVFLGYPDFGTLTIWQHHRGSTPAFENPHTRMSAVPYAFAYRPKAPYKAEEISRDIEAIMKDFRPTKVFYPQSTDIMSDHRALYLFANELFQRSNEVVPERFGYLIHAKDWPRPRGLHKDRTLEPPPLLKDRDHWMTLTLSSAQVSTKLRALQKHRTQYGYSRRFLNSFVRKNELFEPVQGAVESTP